MLTNIKIVKNLQLVNNKISEVNIMNKIVTDGNLGQTLEEKVFEEKYERGRTNPNQLVFSGVGVKRTVWISQHPIPNRQVYQIELIDGFDCWVYPSCDSRFATDENAVKLLYDAVKSKEDVLLLIEARKFAAYATKTGWPSFEGLYKVLGTRDKIVLLGEEGLTQND